MALVSCALVDAMLIWFDLFGVLCYVVGTKLSGVSCGLWFGASFGLVCCLCAV